MTADEIAAECRRIVARATWSVDNMHPRKPTRPEVKVLTKAYYVLPGNGAGGELHAVLDDHNYERGHIRATLASATKVETRWLCHVLLLLSNSQRRRGV